MTKQAKTRTVIKIDDDYRIEVDQLNTMLYRHRVNKDSGKERDETIGYYANMENALRAYMNCKRMAVGECENMDVYIAKIKEIDSECYETISKLCKEM